MELAKQNFHLLNRCGTQIFSNFDYLAQKYKKEDLLAEWEKSEQHVLNALILIVGHTQFVDFSTLKSWEKITLFIIKIIS
jgi:hypothetical protein